MILVFSAGVPSSASAETGSNAATRLPLAEATNALATFQVEKGFRLELAVAEPLIVNPVAMAFEENGRLFVVERRDVSDSRQGVPNPGRIRLLEDTGGEGQFNSSSVYGENLDWPSAIACYGGGVFVAAGTEIVYLKDTKTNGVADLRQVVFSGFGAQTATPGMARLLNSFAWGLDNRIHGVTAGLGGLVKSAGAPDVEPVSIARSDFSFDPRALRLFPEAGPAQSGLSFDSRGRQFVCDFDRPLRLAMSARRYTARNPFFVRPPELLDQAGPRTAIFEGRESRAGTLTAARSCVVYRGTTFPPAYSENVFVADPAAQVIHRFVVRDRGLEAVAARAGNEARSEFLASDDPSFRPQQIVLGPEGALYVADSQNGEERGRIYRIVPGNFKPKKSPPPGKARTYDLVALLAQNNGWECDTAARLLYERRDPAAASLLTDMLNNSKMPLARLRALHALDGLGMLNQAQLLRGLQDPDERVREHAVSLAEPLAYTGNVPDAIWEQFRGLASDSSVRVRYQLAFTLGQVQRPERIGLLAGILRRDFDNAWVRAAVMSSLAEGAGDMFVTLSRGGGFTADAAGRQFLRELALMIGTQGHVEEVTKVLDYVEGASLDTETTFALLSAAGEGLHRTRSSLALLDPQGRLGTFYNQALIGVVNDTLKDSLRIEAIRLVGVMVGFGPYPYSDIADWLSLLFGTGQSQAVQSAGIAALGRYSYPGSATNLIARWEVLTPQLRKEAVAALLIRNVNAPMVLAALEKGRIRAADVPPAYVEYLRTHDDPAVRTRAVKVFGAPATQRPATVSQFTPALRLTGSAARGRELYRSRCAACHEPGDAGQRLGPDLSAARTRGKEKLLSAILEPNREIRPGYEAYVVETKSEEILIGLLVDDSPAAITLAQPDGVRVVWPRANIGALRQQSWSLMPAGLEEGLKPQDMADLLEYIAKGP